MRLFLFVVFILWNVCLAELLFPPYNPNQLHVNRVNSNQQVDNNIAKLNRQYQEEIRKVSSQFELINQGVQDVQTSMQVVVSALETATQGLLQCSK